MLSYREMDIIHKLKKNCLNNILCINVYLHDLCVEGVIVTIFASLSDNIMVAPHYERQSLPAFTHLLQFWSDILIQCSLITLYRHIVLFCKT